MVKEVAILLEDDEPKSGTGGIFEQLMRSVLEAHQYSVTQNVHVTGFEVDLLAKHLVKNEILYAECKAKDKPKSEEVKKFIFAMDYGVADVNPDYGYFIYTRELDRQAAGLKLQLEQKKKNVTFIGPEMIISILVGAGKIKPFNEITEDARNVSKLILVYGPHGFYYVSVRQEGNVPQYFSVINAKTLQAPSEIGLLDIRNKLSEIADLTYEQAFNNHDAVEIPTHKILRDSVVPIKESENWYDYTPASFEHFIGRISIRRNLKGFLEKVRTRKTRKRIFFLDGKSGWGKSSLIAELKGSSKELKYWKGRISVLALDTRGATTANYVGLAFKKLVSEGIDDGFLDNDIFKQVRVASPYDILSDDSIKQLLAELKGKKRLLVLIFDQFEDQFRKEKLFDAFYRFCLDVDSLGENIVVGFSWKSEINIPMGNEAYHQFNQLKDFAYKITIPEFSKNDAIQITRQLSRTINLPLDNELERKLIESSQGYPWLIKKLCIHVLNQINEGKSIEEIAEEEFNCRELFEYDLLNLNGEEKRVLDYIAQRAYDGSPFEISEFDKINQETIDALINKRLVIRTGSIYNIYWDIFRDYLVTKRMPVIGESYILRQSAKGCLNAYLTFRNKNAMSMSEVEALFPYEIRDSTLFNLLLELRMLGLIKKHRGQDIFELTPKAAEVTETFFKAYMTDKFRNYTPFLELEKLNQPLIDLHDIIRVLKGIFKTERFEDSTWDAYAKNILSWFNLSNLEIKARLVELKKGRSAGAIVDKTNQIPYFSPTILLREFERYTRNEEIDDRKFRDFLLFELVNVDEEIVIDPASVNVVQHVLDRAQSMSFMVKGVEAYEANPRLKSDGLISSCPSLFENYTTQVSKRQRASIILSWVKFLLKVNSADNFVLGALEARGSKYYLSHNPDKVLDMLGVMDQGQLNSNDRRKFKDLAFLGVVSSRLDRFVLTQDGMNILNSPNPEHELALIALRKPEILAFKQVYEPLKHTKAKKIEIVAALRRLFEGLQDSSIYTKAIIYKSWIEFINQHEN